MTTPDVKWIEKLRIENLDQYFTLVRMHLSFVVDINTDDVDCSTDKPKQFRWNFHKKTKSSSSNSSQSNTNSTKNNIEPNSITEEGILRLNELIDYLAKSQNVTQEGIFRRTGSLSRQQELRNLLLAGSSLDLEEGKFSVHDCASVLKGFLADLPQPLLMDQYYQTYCTLAGQYPPNAESSKSKLLTALQLLLLLLAPSHRNFLQRLLGLLRLVADNEASNRMSPDTLATMFTPHLLCPRKLSPEIFHADSLALSPVISFMIRHSEELFRAPKQLGTDAAAYFTVRERRRLMSPEVDLDESITDKTAANTVYTFVDRNRTCAENARNPTDTALAQLYAHIQALPDSAHKRRLVKHFNRQNGYGTPIQIQRTGKVAGTRSFGDSIKRHIFNKGLLNKTPKKGSGTNINTVEETSRKSVPNYEAKRTILNSDLDTDSDDSTLSEGALELAPKRSPKFTSEPNLSNCGPDASTPITKRTPYRRLFRSQADKTYRKRGNPVRGIPIRSTPVRACVSCFDPDSASEGETPSDSKPLVDRIELEMQCLTSTPGFTEDSPSDSCVTPYSIHFRRASMSPITKSTQKLSKAMQESIMTPRSRKPLIITSEQRDGLPQGTERTKEAQGTEGIEGSEGIEGAEGVEGTKGTEVAAVQGTELNNDSDFVSSDDEVTPRFASCQRSGCSMVSPFESVRSGRGVLTDLEAKSLSEPFRDYLHSRSVLTATPVDLSVLNRSGEDGLSDSLLYCLDGNTPCDLTASIGGLVVDQPNVSPLYEANERKRNAPRTEQTDSKKPMTGKENRCDNFKLRETDL